jgi:hypothetical protein
MNFDVLIGADICFWDKLTYSLKRITNRAMRTGPQMVEEESDALNQSVMG